MSLGIVASRTHAGIPEALPEVRTGAEERLLADVQAKAEASGAIGFYRNEATGALVILVPSVALRNFDVDSLGPAPIPLEVRATRIDPSDLKALNDRLTTLTATRAKGQSLAFWFDARAERVQVVTTIPTADVNAAVGKAMALAAIDPGAVTLQTRFNDYSPFWGGSALKYYNGSTPQTNMSFDCTSGFGMVSGSTKVLVTAAHCGPINRTVKSPDMSRVIGTTWPDHRYCPIDPEIDTYDNADLQLIKMASGNSVDDTIYVGGLSGTPADVEDAGADPVFGTNYAVSGAKTYEHTGLRVLSLTGSYGEDGCNEGGDGYMTNLIVYGYQQGNQYICPTSGGDSGAPFYFKYTTTPPRALIRGMHTGRINNSNGTSVCIAMRFTRIADVSGFSLMH